MDCLFIHGNYPAQFKYLAPLLAQNGHRVVFLTNSDNYSEGKHGNVEIKKYQQHRNADNKTHPYLQSTEEAILQGQGVIRALAQLRDEGFAPRIIISHGGMGLGLFIKELMPKTIHIGYFEWYFKKETTINLVREYGLDAQLNSEMRNLAILMELEKCDYAVTPTQWQKSQFPHSYQEKIQVIFDGIDESFFFNKKENKVRAGIDMSIQNRETKENFTIPGDCTVISYATRGMEPLRGFPEFMRSIPRLQEKNPKLITVIAGSDRRAYSYGAPTHNGSWKDFLLSELEGKLDMQRILFPGLLDYDDYRNLLWRTDLHCYFTRPYVTSWSLFEAAACGTKLATNRNGATANILEEDSVIWVDIDNQDVMNEQLCAAVNKTNKSSKILTGYELTTTLKKWEKLLNYAIKRAHQS